MSSQHCMQKIKKTWLIDREISFFKTDTYESTAILDKMDKHVDQKHNLYRALSP